MLFLFKEAGMEEGKENLLPMKYYSEKQNFPTCPYLKHSMGRVKGAKREREEKKKRVVLIHLHYNLFYTLN